MDIAIVNISILSKDNRSIKTIKFRTFNRMGLLEKTPFKTNRQQFTLPPTLIKSKPYLFKKSLSKF